MFANGLKIRAPFPLSAHQRLLPQNSGIERNGRIQFSEEHKENHWLCDSIAGCTPANLRGPSTVPVRSITCFGIPHDRIGHYVLPQLTGIDLPPGFNYQKGRKKSLVFRVVFHRAMVRYTYGFGGDRNSAGGTTFPFHIFPFDYLISRSQNKKKGNLNYITMNLR